MGYFAGTNVANDGEGVSEEENKESGGYNKDSVDLLDILDQRWTDERSIRKRGVFRLEIVNGHSRVVLIEIANDSSGNNFDKDVRAGWPGRQAGGGCRDAFNHSALQTSSRNKLHGGLSRC